MTPALFWTNRGPGVREVPDSYPPVVVIPTTSQVVSRRGERWTDVDDVRYYRQLYAAPAELAADWAGFPGARAVEMRDPAKPDEKPRVTLLLPVYTEWAPR